MTFSVSLVAVNVYGPLPVAVVLLEIPPLVSLLETPLKLRAFVSEASVVIDVGVPKARVNEFWAGSGDVKKPATALLEVLALVLYALLDTVNVSSAPLIPVRFGVPAPQPEVQEPISPVRVKVLPLSDIVALPLPEVEVRVQVPLSAGFVVSPLMVKVV